jgi:hypothetical protein
MIVITNSDNTTSWGYIGNNSEAANTVTVYTTIARATPGMNGTSPSGKTPVGYEVRKTDFQITGNLSVGGWIKPTNFTGAGYQTIIAKSSGAASLADFEFRVHKSQARLQLVVSNGSSYPEVSSSDNSLVAGSWNYVVAVISGTNMSLYINGTANGTGSITGTRSESYSPFMVGAREYSLINPFLGSIDSPFVLNTALSAAEVLALYNGGAGVEPDGWLASTNATQSSTKKYAGTYSAKIIAGASREKLTQSINAGAVSVTLTAYCYTTGAAVTSADAQLWYDTDVLATVTYTDMGGGWYRLQKTFTAAAASKEFGVVVEAGKTVYIDTVSLLTGTGETIEVTFENSSSGTSNYTFENKVTAAEVVSLIDGNS